MNRPQAVPGGPWTICGLAPEHSDATKALNSVFLLDRRALRSRVLLGRMLSAQDR